MRRWLNSIESPLAAFAVLAGIAYCTVSFIALVVEALSHG